MAGRQSTDFAIPDVQDAVQIESAIEELRRDIKSDCSELLQRARRINEARPRRGAFRLRYWETCVSQIKEAQMGTFSLEKLKQLKNRCKKLLQQLEQFRK